MAKLGLPYLHIRFTEQGIARIGRSIRGIVALVLQERELKGKFEIYTSSDIPKGLSERNKEQVELALIGYQKTPKKVILVVEQSENADKPKFDVTTEAFKLLETLRWDYLAVPFADEVDSEKIATWIKTLNDNKDKRCKFVAANVNADNKKIINYTMPSVSTEEKEYKTNEYTSRIAGLIAGTPMQIACTYAPLPELKACTHYTQEEINQKIGKGEFVLLNDGEKIKVARGINSLVTTSQLEGESFRKIKIVDIMDAMADDIQWAAQDSYIGKYANSYDNKVLLMSAILGYMEILENDGLLAKGSSHVEINTEAQKAFLKSMGYQTIDKRTVDEMDLKEIKEADTKDKVFLRAYCKILDAIEEIELDVVI
ncbi:phage tail sheath subtilisin-like domain-containing protein [Peptoniphilus sp. SGI.035]|uniref:phage tail sheath subtilisin-like domain-containing protein n=1 Tax=Peptoniphilus sp. SGI.035 TaxID=3420564 RepID=UPI003D077AAE